MPKFKIRFADGKDLTSCINLSKTSWPQWWAKNMKIGKEHIENRTKEKTVLVAEKNKEVVGYIVWGILWNKIHIEDIFVKKEYRMQRLGTLLMNKAVVIARKRGFKIAMSDCGVGNIVSREFHLKNGFRDCGYIKKEWGNEDSYVFEKVL